MKKAILLLFTLLGLSSIKAQVMPDHYLDSTVIWRIGYEAWSDSTITAVFSSRFTDGIVTINNQYYYRISNINRSIRTDISSGQLIDDQISQAYTIYYLREDSSGHFFYVPMNSNTEWLFADFNQTVGAPFTMEPSCTVNSLDTVYLDSTPLKKYTPAFSPLNASIIEGVGTTASYICAMGFEGNWRMVCYEKDGYSIQIDSSQNCGSYPPPVYRTWNSTSQVNPISNIKLYPNPSSEYFSISGDIEGSSVEVYNSLGVKVKAFPFQAHTQYAIADLPAGTYFVRIGTYLSRLIKQ